MTARAPTWRAAAWGIGDGALPDAVLELDGHLGHGIDRPEGLLQRDNIGLLLLATSRRDERGPGLESPGTATVCGRSREPKRPERCTA